MSTPGGGLPLIRAGQWRRAQRSLTPDLWSERWPAGITCQGGGPLPLPRCLSHQWAEPATQSSCRHRPGEKVGPPHPEPPWGQTLPPRDTSRRCQQEAQLPIHPAPQEGASGGSSPRAPELPAGPFRPQFILTEGGRPLPGGGWQAWGMGPAPDSSPIYPNTDSS